MFDYEKLGAFYLGREFDPATGESSSHPVLYDAKDLTTHAVIVGMTGSGKTGLGITLLEEAAIDGIPALIIDPKGDMGNLVLTFPGLRPADFEPWIEPEEALRQGMTVADCAAKRAQLWRDGLAQGDQPIERIERFRSAADVAIYTPGSDCGLPLAILKSLDAPPAPVRSNADALRERISSSVSGLLTLLGIDSDPLRSREHILLSNILEHAWQAGRNLDLFQLIREIQNPPFGKIGVMDLEMIFPAGERMSLAMTINNLLASPAYSSWTQGAPLDIQKLLCTDEGRPRLAILSIAHLSEKERMFFVTILLNEVLTWMRSQPGTSSLRAILYMDEVFGYLPPTANPPSKTPLLTLLKQARAYGLGLVLATQNPVDLDYKALSNAGAWFLGRLQTERDKLRILDGLEGASAAAGAAFDRRRTETILSGLSNRVFLLNNVHENAPVVFQSRWALSYLRGPMTRQQVQTLMAPRRNSERTSSAPSSADSSRQPAKPQAGNAEPPVLPPEIHQRFLPVGRNVPRDASILYKPALLAIGRAHYVDAKSKVDEWRDVALLVSVVDAPSRDPWEDADEVDLRELRNDEAIPGARYAELPSECSRPTSYKNWASSFKNFLFRARPLTLQFAPDLKLYSSPGDREGDFRARLAHQAREQRDLEMQKLRQAQAAKVERFKDRIRRAQQQVDKERQQAGSATMSAAMTFGSSVLGALFGRKKLSSTNLNRAATSMRAATRAADQRSDIKRAEENVESLQQEWQTLNNQVEKDLERVRGSYSPDEQEIESYEVRARKSDLSVDEVSLLWMPHVPGADGRLRTAFDNQSLVSSNVE